MVQLQGADPETVQRMAREKGSLPVRLAMLGLAASRKQESPLWWDSPQVSLFRVNTLRTRTVACVPYGHQRTKRRSGG